MATKHYGAPTDRLNIRNLDPDLVTTVRKRSRVRGISQGEYLARLVNLHAACLAQAERVKGLDVILRFVDLAEVREADGL